MRVALLFERPDVDQFMDELPYDSFQEWAAFTQLEPQGWQAASIALTRSTYINAQCHAKKKLRERDFQIKIGGNVHSPEVEKARFEAYSIRTQVEEATKDRG